MIQCGLYLLLIHLPRPRTIQVGRLGEFDFPAGYYVYTGSAMNGLEARIRRHLRQEKKLRWHIDYLLPFACIEKVVTFPLLSSAKEPCSGGLECRLNESVLRLPGATIVVPRFGASDCRCRSHLICFGELLPNLELL